MYLRNHITYLTRNADNKTELVLILKDFYCLKTAKFVKSKFPYVSSLTIALFNFKCYMLSLEPDYINPKIYLILYP